MEVKTARHKLTFFPGKSNTHFIGNPPFCGYRPSIERHNVPGYLAASLRLKRGYVQKPVLGPKRAI